MDRVRVSCVSALLERLLSPAGVAVLITGSASGVGLGAAKLACSGGATVLVHARNRRGRLGIESLCCCLVSVPSVTDLS